MKDIIVVNGGMGDIRVRIIVYMKMKLEIICSLYWVGR